MTTGARTAADGSIGDVPGLRVGHWTDLRGGTGCTVVLCGGNGAVGGVAVRGGAPGTRETDLLRPGNLVERVHAVLLAGGSAFGLEAASGVMRYLEERGMGFPTPAGPVPIVPAAVLFDLSVGRADARPDAQAGYAACVAAEAATGGGVAEGSVGAGTGASVAKLLGPRGAVKGGIGTAARRLADGRTIVGALVAVNAVGAVYDPDSGAPVALSRSTVAESAGLFAGVNTTIGVVATNARLDKAGAARLASLAHDGLARALRPAHTLYDGDTLFALSLADDSVPTADPLELGAAAAEVVARAIVRGVRAAQPLHGLPSVGRA